MNYRIRTVEDLRRVLRSYRKKKDLDQNTLAERAGVSRQTISEFENGKNTRIETIMAILRGLDTSFSLVDGPSDSDDSSRSGTDHSYDAPPGSFGGNSDESDNTEHSSP